MAALHLLASQSTQLERAGASGPNMNIAMPALAPASSTTATTATYPGLSTPVYPYQRENQHPLLSGALRRGKWTPEEEEYAASIIRYFLSGVLPIQYGTTLRGYIAQLLHCDPMRVSKKLVPGTTFVNVRIDPKIGRRSYYPCPMETPGLDEHKERAERHLADLRTQFIESIEREELHEQQSKVASTTTTGQRVLSPLKPKDTHTKYDMGEKTHNQDGPTRTASLPSLNELLRQNRLREPSPVMGAVDGSPAHSSMFQYASPPHQAWQPSQPAIRYHSPPRDGYGYHQEQYALPSRAAYFPSSG